MPRGGRGVLQMASVATRSRGAAHTASSSRAPPRPAVAALRQSVLGVFQIIQKEHVNHSVRGRWPRVGAPRAVRGGAWRGGQSGAPVRAPHSDI